MTEALLATRGGSGVVGLIISLGVIATLSRLLGRPEEAARFEGAFEGLGQTYGVQMPGPLIQLLELAEARASIPDELDPDVRQGLLEASRRMTFDQVLEFVEATFGERLIASPSAEKSSS